MASVKVVARNDSCGKTCAPARQASTSFVLWRSFASLFKNQWGLARSVAQESTFGSSCWMEAKGSRRSWRMQMGSSGKCCSLVTKDSEDQIIASKPEAAEALKACWVRMFGSTQDQVDVEAFCQFYRLSSSVSVPSLRRISKELERKCKVKQPFL